jgi:hypothetical protein
VLRAPEREGTGHVGPADAPLEDAHAESRQIDALLQAVDAPQVPPQVRQTYGVVETESGASLVVRVGPKSVAARRAASCLLEPKAGDQVLVAVTDDAHSFVLAVLVQGEREAKGGVLSLEGDITLRAATGKVAVVGRDPVTLTSATQVAVSAPELAVHALKTSFFSESLSYIGRKLDGEVERIKVVAQVLDSTIDRMSQRLKRSYRNIEEMEHVKAKALDVVVEGNMSVHSDNAVVSADKLVKVDGEQIHLG